MNRIRLGPGDREGQFRPEHHGACGINADGLLEDAQGRFEEGRGIRPADAR